MYFDIDKAQLSAFGKSAQSEEIKMTKAEILKMLKAEKILTTDMLPVIGMPFEVFLRYAKMNKENQQRIVNKAIQKLDPEYCGACECSPCDCGYGSY